LSAKGKIENLQPGEYAVFALHDGNGNGKVDSNFVGVPTEGFGVPNLALVAFWAYCCRSVIGSADVCCTENLANDRAMILPRCPLKKSLSYPAHTSRRFDADTIIIFQKRAPWLSNAGFFS
jgi:hypothetical protein